MIVIAVQPVAVIRMMSLVYLKKMMKEIRYRFSFNYGGNFQHFQFLIIFILKVASGALYPHNLSLLLVPQLQGILWR